MRNHWKNKKKLKKWKKEMKRKKDLKVFSPKIIERVDRFGKESSFVNRLGSVPSTVAVTLVIVSCRASSVDAVTVWLIVYVGLVLSGIDHGSANGETEIVI